MNTGTVRNTKLIPGKAGMKVHLKQQKIAPYIFVLPFIISFSIFFLYPIISTVIMSFQEILGPKDVTFIGLKNYRNMINEHFFNAIWVTTRYTFLTILVLVPLPMILAVFLNRKKTIGRNFFRSAFFIPRAGHDPCQHAPGTVRHTQKNMAAARRHRDDGNGHSVYMEMAWRQHHILSVRTSEHTCGTV